MKKPYKEKTLLILLFLLTTILQSQEDNPQKIVSDFLIGATSGSFAMTIYAPFNYVQNKLIQQHKIEWNNPSAFFRGAPGLILGKAPIIATQMATHRCITRLMQKSSSDELTSRQNKIAATLAGGLSAPICNITQLVAVHQQNKHLSFFKTIDKFPQRYRSLGRGNLTIIQREMIFTNIFYDLLPLINSRIKNWIHDEKKTLLASSLMCGGMIAIVTQPYQVVLTELHADIEKKKFKNALCAVKHIAQSDGVKGFYKASASRSIGVVCAITALNTAQTFLTHYVNSSGR